MKKILGVAAAALLLSAGAASAGTTNITVTLLGYSCTVAVSTFSDSANGIASKVLLAGSSPGCYYVGGGSVGKVKNVDGQKSATLATLVGTSSLASSHRIVTLLDYPFVTGGTYRAYDTTDGTKLTFVNKGTYTVGP
jgi:hypothetical protein